MNSRWDEQQTFVGNLIFPISKVILEVLGFVALVVFSLLLIFFTFNILTLLFPLLTIYWGIVIFKNLILRIKEKDRILEERDWKILCYKLSDKDDLYSVNSKVLNNRYYFHFDEIESTVEVDIDSFEDIEVGEFCDLLYVQYLDEEFYELIGVSGNEN